VDVADLLLMLALFAATRWLVGALDRLGGGSAP
jgi:hypothetical protein